MRSVSEMPIDELETTTNDYDSEQNLQANYMINAADSDDNSAYENDLYQNRFYQLAAYYVSCEEEKERESRKTQAKREEAIQRNSLLVYDFNR